MCYTHYHKFIIGFLFFLWFGEAAQAQTKYWVFFKDKPVGEKFNPYTYFHKNALERRENANLPLYDFTDLPVNEDYIKEIESFADSMGNKSRWLNATGVWATEENINKIKKLPFVKNISAMTIHLQAAETDVSPQDMMISDTFLLQLQLRRMQGNAFEKAGASGKGIRIAVLDVGFKGADTHPAFAHLRQRGKIIMTHDFIKNNLFVYGFGTHGTMVLSCIAGKYQDSLPMGLAPDAEFLLARTERAITEWKDEEDNWVAAMEWADKNGAQIISSSLGYTYKRYFYRDMDGKTSLISRAANLAARKGILVITAAGNDGKSDWKYICTPGDADSALTVGGTDPRENYHISFSSYGPAADGSMKPNVSAPGQAFVADAKDYTQAFGTSFSTPLVAGFAACAWQMNKQLTNMQLFKEIEKSASLYPYFDYAHGYGIPEADYFIRRENSMLTVAEKTFSFINTNDSIIIQISDSFLNNKALNIKFKNAKFYYNISMPDGEVVKYYVIQPKNSNVVVLKKEDLPVEGILRAHFLGYTEELSY